MAVSSQLGRKIATNSLVAVIAAGIYMVSRIALTPLVLAFVTLEEFGIWGFCFTILGYVVINGPGVHSAYEKYSAEFAAKGNIEQLNKLLSTGLMAMTVVCLLVFGVIALATPLLLDYFAVDPKLRHVAEILIVGTSAAFLMDAAFSGFYSIACGLQEIAVMRIIWLLVSLVEIALIVALLFLGWGIVSLLYAYAARIVIQTAAYMVYALKRIPGLKVRLKYFCPELLRTLFSFGSKVQIISFLAMLMITLDKLIATSLLGFAAGGLFEIGRKFPMTAGMIVTPVFSPIVPAASHIGGKWQNLEETDGKSRRRRYVKLALLSLASGLLFLAPYPILAPNYPLLWSLGIVSTSGLILFSLRKWIRSGFARQDKLDSTELQSLYLQGARHSNLLSVFAFGFLAAISPALIYAWVGKGYESAEALLIVICLWSITNLLTGVGTQIFRGIDRTGREFEYLIVQLTLAILWIAPLTMTLGLLGAALGTLLSTAAACCYFLWQTHRCMNIRPMFYLKKALAPTLFPACLSIAVAQVIKLLPLVNRWETLGQVAGIGLAYLALNLVIIKSLILSEDEWKMAKDIILRRP